MTPSKLTKASRKCSQRQVVLFELPGGGNGAGAGDGNGIGTGKGAEQGFQAGELACLKTAWVNAPRDHQQHDDQVRRRGGSPDAGSSTTGLGQQSLNSEAPSAILGGIESQVVPGERAGRLALVPSQGALLTMGQPSVKIPSLGAERGEVTIAARSERPADLAKVMRSVVVPALLNAISLTSPNQESA